MILYYEGSSCTTLLWRRRYWSSTAEVVYTVRVALQTGPSARRCIYLGYPRAQRYNCWTWRPIGGNKPNMKDFVIFGCLSFAYKCV